jgi:citrate lyase subunit beta / citryl-CoA lyase
MEVESGLPLGHTVIYPVLETAQALRLAYDIAMASGRILYMGGAVSRFGDIHPCAGFPVVTPERFEKFTFTNAVRLLGDANPAFFEGSTCEDVTKALL